MIEIEALSYRYPGLGDEALQSVSLSVEAGEFVLLAGDSGSGKSTLLRAIGALVPHFFGGELCGRVLVSGMDTREQGANVLADTVASVFQDPESQVVMTSVESELRLPLEQRGVGAHAAARALEEASLVLGINHLRDRLTVELSGGELQRVALAAALVVSPELVLLDEPTSQLDPVAADELFALLKRLNREHAMTVVLSEHRLERCLPYADRVIALVAGRVAFDGTPGRYLAWAIERAPHLATPLAKLAERLELPELPTDVKAARSLIARSDPCLGDRSGNLVSPGPTNDPRRSRRWRAAARRRDRQDPAVALRVEGVSHSFSSESLSNASFPSENLAHEGEAKVLDRVGFAVQPGERIALMGSNGAGKSTLLRAIKGLIQPRQGRIDVDRDAVALLTQHPSDYLLHERVVDELPAVGAEELLRALDLERFREWHPRDLSVGGQQRLALAVVLSSCQTTAGARPAVTLLDEPTRGIDRAGKQAMVELIGSLAERGSAVIVATHDVEFAARFATRVLLLARGRLIADGSPAEVLSGGWYYATDVARVMRDGTSLVPEDVPVEPGEAHAHRALEVAR